MNTRKNLVAGAIAGIGLLAGNAHAMLLDFEADPAAQGSAEISWDGEATSGLVGTNIGITELYAADTPEHEGETYDVLDGNLSFTTGALESQYTMGSWEVWEFGGGGSITLTGTVDLNGNGIADDSSDTTIFDGEFDSATVQGNSLGGYEVVLSFFHTNINEDLLAFFGLDTKDADGNPIVWMGQFNLLFDIDDWAYGASGNGFYSNTINGGYVKQMPSPATLMLLGAGLLGLGATKRLQKRKAA